MFCSKPTVDLVAIAYVPNPLAVVVVELIVSSTNILRLHSPSPAASFLYSFSGIQFCINYLNKSSRPLRSEKAANEECFPPSYNFPAPQTSSSFCFRDDGSRRGAQFCPWMAQLSRMKLENETKICRCLKSLYFVFFIGCEVS